MSCALEDLDQPLVLTRVVLELLELVARRTERTRWGMSQGTDRCCRLLARVDEILGQRSDDAVSAGVHLPDLVLVLAGGLDDPAGGSVDDSGDAARLGIERIARYRSGHCTDLC